MTEKTIKQTIHEHLLKEGASWGGTICRAVHDILGTKEAVVERRLREMFNEGLLDRCYKQVEGVGPACVRYRIKQLN